MARWRLRMVFRLPGPWVLSRDSGSPRIREAVPRTPGRGNPVSGFIALFFLGWLVSWRVKTRGKRPRHHIRPWIFYTCMIVVVLAILVVL